MSRVNLHTHTTFCDGKNTAEEMVQAAIAKNYDSLGFSGHAPMEPGQESWCMREEDMQAYADCINALKERYKGQLDIFLGLELDYYSPAPSVELDFVIGSVHCIRSPYDGKLYSVDNDKEEFSAGLHACARGDVKRFVGMYYDLVVRCARRIAKMKCDNLVDTAIIGHFDVIKKLNSNSFFFDENAAWYRGTAMEAAKECCFSELYLEENTGGIFKGYRKDPYPSDFIKQTFIQNGIEILESKDAHSIDAL